MPDENTPEADTTTTTTTEDNTATDATSTAETTTETTADTLGDGGKKALDAERAQRKAVEKELAGIKKAQEKAAEEARLAKLSDDEKRDEIAKAATERAEKAEARAAVLDAARKHGIADDKDLELLSKLPADQVDEVAKRLSAAQKTAPGAPAGPSGTEVKGAKQKAPLEQQLADAQKAKDWPRVIALKQQLYSK